MSNGNDPLFGIHTQALSLWQRRAEVLASNLANADTPGYLARDVDFRSALAAQSGDAAGDVRLALTEPGHPAAAGSDPATGAALKYRVPLQPSMDGNTVDPQMEQAAYAENSVRYQASLTFITAQIRMLRTAITGGG